MSDKSWKRWERRVAAAIDGTRYPANLGAAVDAESAWAVAQCKEVRTLSLAALTALAKDIERTGAAAGKIGIVGVKLRRGRGRPATPLIVLTLASWHRLRARWEEEGSECRGNALSLALDARNAEVRELKAERAALREALVHATQHGAANMHEIESVLATVDARKERTDA